VSSDFGVLRAVDAAKLGFEAGAGRVAPRWFADAFAAAGLDLGQGG
jgi:hypothetical protein